MVARPSASSKSVHVGPYFPRRRLIVEFVLRKVFYEVFEFFCFLTQNESLQLHAAKAHRPKTRPPGGIDLRSTFISP